MSKNRKPHGWFTRVVRRILEPIWEQQYMQLGSVERWESRNEGWEEVKESVGIGIIEQLAKERYSMSESQVLSSNQNTFRAALKDARIKLSSQGILPFGTNQEATILDTIKQEIHTALFPISGLFLRKPGPDQDFGELVKVMDVDFDIAYEMVVVRDESERTNRSSKEDYEFLDTTRRALQASNKATLGQVFDLYSAKKSA